MDRNARLFVAQLAASSSGDFFGVVRLHLCSTIKVVHEYSISTGTKVYTSAHSFCITIKRANLGRFFIVVLQQMRRFRVWQTSHSFICILVVYLVVQSASCAVSCIDRCAAIRSVHAALRDSLSHKGHGFSSQFAGNISGRPE